MEYIPGTLTAKARHDLKKLDPPRLDAFLVAWAALTEDVSYAAPLRPSLRVKRVVNSPGVWEFTWARNGRATFSYTEDGSGLVLRRVGGHDIFRQP